MAIVKMKYVEVGASYEDYKDVLMRISKCDFFHAEPAASLYNKNSGEKLLEQDTKYNDAMSQLKNFIVKGGHQIEKKEELIKFTDEELKEHIDKLNQEFSVLATEKKSRVVLTSEDEKALNILREYDFERLNSTMFLKFIFGRLPVNSYTKLLLHKTGLFKAVVIHKSDNYYWLCVAVSATYFKEVYDILDSLYFEDIGIPRVDAQKIVAANEDEINTLFTYCSYRNDIYRLYKFVRIVDGRYVISGFIPAVKQKEFNEIFRELDVFTTFEDPIEATKKPHPLTLNSELFAESLSKININNIHNSKFLKFTYGIVNNNGYEQLSHYEENLFKIYELSQKGVYHWICYVTTKELYREVRKIFEDSDFREIHLSQEDLDDITRIYTQDKTDVERFRDLKEKFSSLDKYFKIEEGGSKNIKAPTLLKNNWFCRPFELFVEMYGVPAYNGIDPTPIVAVTYFLLFGVMFGDLGQGLVLMILGFYMEYRKPENKLFGIIGRIGISSSIFGFIFGSVFGLETILDPIHQSLFGVKHKLFEVMAPESTMTLIIGAITVGIILILMSMILNMIVRIRNHEMGELLFNQNGLTGFIFYLFIILMMLGNLTGLYNISNPISNVLFIALPIIIFVFEKPLISLVDGDGFRVEEGWKTYLAQIPFEIFELLLSFVTNTMSYMRIGGFVLSHAGMMMVVMILMKTASTSGSILIFVIGNIFVMGLEGLIVGIQALRLELYEMFSRYFRSGGRRFVLISEDL